MRRFPRVFGSATAVLMLLVALGGPTARISAQPIAPIYLQYDGFVRNKDGSIILSFGYFNMNNVDVTVPAGDGNGFTPGPADRNQPVSFLKGRHRFACSLIVDKTFDGTLQWTVKFAGKTQTTTPNALDPLYELELNNEKRAMAGLDLATAARNVCVNRAPSVALPTNVTVLLDQEASINGQIEDDGLPRGSKVAAAWKKVSGPGVVTFSDASAGPTRAKFSAPGAYVLELSATDGEKVNALKVNVTVSAPVVAEKAPEAYVKAMKNIGAAQAMLRTHTTAKDYDAIAADAAALKPLFAATGAFWQPRNAADATGFVSAGAKAIDDLSAAAKGKNDDGIAAASRSLGGTCQGCHAAHRDRQPDGTFTIR